MKLYVEKQMGQQPLIREQLNTYKKEKKKKSKKKRDANAMHPPVRYFDNRKDLSDNIVQQVFEYYFSI